MKEVIEQMLGNLKIAIQNSRPACSDYSVESGPAVTELASGCPKILQDRQLNTVFTTGQDLSNQDLAQYLSRIVNTDL